MAKVTQEDVVAFLKQREAELQTQLDQVRSAISAIGGNGGASIVAQAAASAPAAGGSVAKRPGRPTGSKKQEVAAVAQAVVEPKKRGPKPKNAQAAAPAAAEAPKQEAAQAEAPKAGRPRGAGKQAAAKGGAKQRANYLPKGNWDETKTLTDKIIYILNERNDASTEELVSAIKDRGINMSDSTLESNVAQYVSILKGRKVLKAVSKEGRKFRYALA